MELNYDIFSYIVQFVDTETMLTSVRLVSKRFREIVGSELTLNTLCRRCPCADKDHLSRLKGGWTERFLFYGTLRSKLPDIIESMIRSKSPGSKRPKYDGKYGVSSIENLCLFIREMFYQTEDSIVIKSYRRSGKTVLILFLMTAICIAVPNTKVIYFLVMHGTFSTTKEICEWVRLFGFDHSLNETEGKLVFSNGSEIHIKRISLRVSHPGGYDKCYSDIPEQKDLVQYRKIFVDGYSYIPIEMRDTFRVHMHKTVWISSDQMSLGPIGVMGDPHLRWSTFRSGEGIWTKTRDVEDVIR
jgi:hypothetical protein